MPGLIETFDYVSVPKGGYLRVLQSFVRREAQTRPVPFGKDRHRLELVSKDDMRCFGIR